MSKTLNVILYQAEASGEKPGTPGFDRKVRALKVEKCRELQPVRFCSECPAFMDCELLKEHLRDQTSGGANGQKQGQ